MAAADYRNLRAEDTRDLSSPDFESAPVQGRFDMQSRFRAVRRGIAGATAVLTVFLVFGAGSALAAPTIDSFTVSPNTANAGATGAGHNVVIHLGFGGTSGTDQDLKDLTIHLPPGLIANPQAAPKCTVAKLNSDTCPAASQVGEVSNTVLVLGLPVDAPGKLYNLVAQPGEPGRFGIILKPLGGLQKVTLQSGAALRSSDYGLDSILENLPDNAGGVPIDITAIDLTLYGKGGANHDQGNFARLPTSCGTQTFGVDATNYANQSTSGSTSINTVNCANQPFSPVLSAKIGAPGKTSANSLPPVTTQITQTIEEAGLKRAQVRLPFGVSGNTDFLLPERYCSEATFASDSSMCPATSIIGQAVAASPLLADPLTGPLVLVNTPTPFPSLGLDLNGALHLKLFGSLGLGPNSDGQITTGVDFSTLPDIPISNFRLAFKQNGLNLIARDICSGGPLEFDAVFDSFGNTHSHKQPEATVEGCGSSPPPGGKKPKAKVKLSHATSKNPAAKLKVSAGAKKIRKVKLTLPSKLKPAGTSKLRHHSHAKTNGKKVNPSAITKRGRSIFVKLKKARTASLKLKRGALTAHKPAKAGSRLKFKVVITDTAGRTKTLTKTVKVHR